MQGLGAAITAGGQSRRFGSDKALYRWRGQTLLEHVACSLEDCAPKLLIAPPGKYALPGWQNLPDRRPGEGPLAGLETALGEAPGWTAFAAVDLPGLTRPYWAALAAHRSGARVVCALDAQGRAQPLAALYHPALLPRVSGLLDAGERRIRAVLEGAEVCFVPWAELAPLGASLFRNANTPHELG